MRPNYIHVGILALFITFSVAFFFSFLILSRFGDSFHIVTPLYGGPGTYTEYRSQITFYGIFPIATSLGLSVVAFAVERKFPSDGSFSVPFVLFGIPSIIWGIIYLSGTLNAYSGSVKVSTEAYGGSMNSLVLSVYQMIGLTGVLWLVTGILLVLLAKKEDAI